MLNLQPQHSILALSILEQTCFALFVLPYYKYSSKLSLISSVFLIFQLQLSLLIKHSIQLRTISLQCDQILGTVSTIIVAFNKLRMHSDSKDLTIFITFFDSYKYHVMLFELINKLTFYQHYMNDVLFKYLHQFCQIYLDDIIIYSKILKKHKRHVRLILNRLREADLQIDINKCKFHVQKIIFLELLMSIEELKINSRKMQAVVD